MNDRVGKIKVLFLEDDEVIRDVTVEYLKLADYEVTVCENGNEAVSLFCGGSFDFVILDIMVPGISGLEVLKKIRGTDENTGVIMMSALGDEKVQIESFTAMADDYIIKPASPILLLKRMETILRRSARSMKEDSTAGIRIDREGYKIFENGKKVDFTLTEYLLFTALYDRREKVFTRDELLDEVYGTDYFGSDRVIDSHIKNMRKKLAGSYIETVIGVGYRWKEERL